MQWNDARLLPLALSALLAGMVNSVAGGGSLLTFPMLLAVGLSPLQANATSTLALVPGSLAAFWGYRSQLTVHPQLGRSSVVMALPSLIGGTIGALLALRAGERLFAKFVPWLILLATVLFAFAPTGETKAVDASSTNAADVSTDRREYSLRSLAMLACFQFLVATYGGFFGAGIGIMMLAALSLAGFRDIHSMNALKNLAAVLINAGAIVVFVLDHRADLSIAAVMAIAAVIGGRSGAQLAQRVGRKRVRQMISTVGLLIAMALFAKQLRS